MQIEQLPDSLLLQVFKHLMFRDVCTCARVCRRWRQVAGDRTLRRAVNALSTPLSLRKALSLVRACGGRNLVELRISGRVNMYFSKHKGYRFTPKFFRHLANSCPSLEVLYVTNAFLASNSTTTTATFADLPATLVKLSLRDCFFHPAEFFHTNPLRPALPHLQLLDLGRCSLVSSIELKKLERLPQLRALCLEGCYRVNDGGISNIPHVLDNLLVLDIEGTEITDRGLCMVLGYGIHLKCLFVGHTQVTGKAFSEALPYIRRHLESSEGLTHICLRRTRVTEGHLSKLLEVSPHLVFVTVTSPYLSVDAKARLEQSVSKSCRILDCCAPYEAEVKHCEHFGSGIVDKF